MAQLWDLRKSTQEPIRSLSPNPQGTWGAFNVLIFSSDEHWLVVNETAAIQVLDLQNPTGEPITLRGLVEAVDKIALSPNGHWLAGSYIIPNLGWEVRLWNLQNPTADPIVLLRQEGSIAALGFSPNEKWLAVGLDSVHPNSSRLELWPLEIDDVSKLACDIIGSNLSRQQWEENFPPEKQYQRTCPRRPEGKDRIVLLPAG